MRASRPPTDPPGQPLTLVSLAHRARTSLLSGSDPPGIVRPGGTRAGTTRVGTGRVGTTLRLVPVHGRDGAWLVLRARGRMPQLTPLRVPVEPAGLDLGLQVDLLLRWIDPPPPAHGTGAAGSVPADVAKVAPLALLVERAGDAELTDTDLGWWRAFRIAAGIVGRRPVAACLACSGGVRDIRDQHDAWPQPARPA
jgi:hypothetical protein